MVFQHYGLWPHMDARDTVAYPLRRAGTGRAGARAEAAKLLGDRVVGIVPVDTLHDVERRMSEEQIEARGAGKLEDLIYSGELWTVGDDGQVIRGRA